MDIGHPTQAMSIFGHGQYLQMNFADALADRLAAGAAALTGSILARVCTPRLSILIFHRVHARADLLFPDEPDAARFERIVRFAATGFRVLRLDDAISLLANDNLPARSMVITFDDGYADNTEVAMPILRRAGLPATFFISTGFLDGGRMWNDTVIECIRACKLEQIDLSVFGLGLQRLRSISEQRETIGRVLKYVKYLDLTKREYAIRELVQLTRASQLPRNLMMSGAQVRQLHAVGMEIGAHTVNHPILATLGTDEAIQEISVGKSALEAMIQAPVKTFAYPNGNPTSDYGISHVEIVRSCGFLGAVSTAIGAAYAGVDLFQLPRFTPWNTSMAAWAVKLVANQTTAHYRQAALLEETKVLPDSGRR